jgi:hypothetical protein
VLVPEAQELVDERERRVVRPPALPRALGDDVGEVLALLGHLLRQHEDRRLDVGEVLVEGRRRRARVAGDVDDLHVAVRRCRQHVAGALEEALAGGPAPSARDAAVGRPQGLVVVQRSHVTHGSRLPAT